MTYRNRQQAGGWGLWALLHTSTHGASATGPTPIQAVRVTGRPESLTYQKKNQNPLGIHKGKEAQPSCTGFWKGRMRPRKRNHRTSLATFQPESFRETKGSSSHTHTHTHFYDILQSEKFLQLISYPDAYSLEEKL